MDIKIQKRAVLTAVGTKAQFTECVETFGNLQESAELALARMVAFAFHTWHKGGADKTYGVDTIREEVTLAKDSARRLGNCLNRIGKTEIPEGASLAKVSVLFANDFVADFYRHETKARAAQAEARKEAQIKKAKEAAKKAADDVKALTEAAKAEGKAEAEVEVVEFTLVGKDGFTIALTEAEYTMLAIHLNDIRTEAAAEPKLSAVG